MATPDSCEKIVLKEYVLSGPQGEDGEKGDTGETVAFPIAASNISVTNAGFSTAQEIFDFLLYIAPVISSFSTGIVLFENRLASHVSADFDISFAWSLNKSITVQTLTGPIEMTPVALDPADRGKLVTMTNFNTNRSFTLEVDDGEARANSVVSSTINIEFTNRVYFGDSVIPGLIDADFIKTLPSIIQKTFDLETISTTTTDTYWWIAVPVAYGAPYVQDDFTGFPIDMQDPLPFTIGNGNQFVNDLDHAEDYNLYRTTNDNLGAGIQIKVA